ncbi:twin-arginine translocase TatA/TatE family subunit [Rubritalea tangerina]|uniref:Sec-independent protein translocase protein TatA n=2 Tax=Rubritalea tangerina TaxID=430798 RepID=A0ABW4Z910_9BACT
MNTPLSFVSLPQGGEMIIIFIIILLLFGAKKLPQLARGVGKSMGEFKRAREEFENEITRAEHEETTKSDKKAPAKAEKEDKEEA